jgi:hypothetical protein
MAELAEHLAAAADIAARLVEVSLTSPMEVERSEHIWLRRGTFGLFQQARANVDSLVGR